jgi:AraC-like DNA-binding protein
VRHVGQDDAVAQASQVLFFNPYEGYQVSHPIEGGDACLDLVLDGELLSEIIPKALLQDRADLAFRNQRERIDPCTQALVALLRNKLQIADIEPLEAEGIALAVVRQAFEQRTSPPARSTKGKQRLVNRLKLLLATDVSRRWTLAEIAYEVGGSPVYLTQVFQQVEGIPLYRHQLRLRLTRALDLLGKYDDLAAVGVELGFSSHSHFSSAFQRTYGCSPSEFRASLRGRKSLKIS